MKKCKQIPGMFLTLCMLVGMLTMSVLAAALTPLTINSATMDENGTLAINGEDVNKAYFNIYTIDDDTKNVAYVIDGDTDKINLPTEPGEYVLYIDLSRVGEEQYDLTNRGFWFTYEVAGPGPVVSVTGVTIDKEELSLTVGESAALTATVTPDNATGKTVTWASSDEKTAAVDEAGVVTAVGIGTATITAEAGEFSAACEVTVTGDNESGDNESGDNESGDNESGDNESGDDESGDNESGDNESGDNESGDDAPGDDEPEDNAPGDDEPEDNAPGDDEPEDNESGDGSAAPATPSESVTIPVPKESGGATGGESGGDVTANVEVQATVTGTTASVTVSGEEIVRAITGEAGEPDGEGGGASAQKPDGVVIDLSNIPGREIKSAELPSGTLQTVLDTFRTALEDAGLSGTGAPVLTVKLSSGAVAFDTAALEAVVGQAGGKEVQFKVNLDNGKGTSYLSATQREAVKDKEIFAGVDACAFTNSGRIGDFGGGSVKMSIPFEIPEGYHYAGFSVWYVSGDGGLEKHAASWKNGKLYWTVRHFSDYIIAYDEADIGRTVYPDKNGGTACADTVKVVVDGGEVRDMYAYALQDEEGNSTHYLKLRDIAALLNGTAAQFEVGYDGAVNIVGGKAYTAVGEEMVETFTGDRTYKATDVETRVNGVAEDIAAFCLTHENGDGYNYYQVRDLGDKLGFNVYWDAAAGAIIIQTDRPYTGSP